PPAKEAVELFGHPSPRPSKPLFRSWLCCSDPGRYPAVKQVRARFQTMPPATTTATLNLPSRVVGRVFEPDSGSAPRSAITAQHVPAYDRNSSLSYGNPVEKYFGLTSAGESMRVRVRHVPSLACVERRNFSALLDAASAAGISASCNANKASPV